MQKEFITNNYQETQKLGELLAMELCGGEIICLDGDLGAGKTTFTQGLLKGLKVRGPYTSPTFLIMKEYRLEDKNLKSQISNLYHFDVYRVGEDDILNLGWKEIVADDKNVVIVEWSERIKNILPKNSVRIKFEWLDPPRVDEQSSPRVEAGENQRKITFLYESNH